MAEALFGTNITEVGVNLQGAKTQALKAQSIANSDTGLEGVSELVTGAVNTYTTTKKTIDSNKASMDYINMVTSEQYLDLDDVGKAEQLENIYGGLAEEPSAYVSTFKSLSSGEFVRADKGRRTKENNALYNSAYSSSLAYAEAPSGQIKEGGEGRVSDLITNEEAGKTKADFVNDYTKANPQLEKVVVSRSLLAGAYQEIEAAISMADRTEEGLATLRQDIADIKAPYESPMFLTTREKQGQEYVNALERGMQTQLKGFEAEIKNNHYSKLAANAKDGYRALPSTMYPSIDATASNPLAAEKQKQEVDKKYQERTQADVYNSTYPVGDRPGALPLDNPLLKKERQAAVTKELFSRFLVGDSENFTRIADNEGQLTREIGQSILVQFNKSSTNEEINSILDRVKEINEQPSGARVLRQMFTDDEYTRVLGVSYMSQARPDWDMKQVKDFVDQAQQATTTVKLSPSDNSKIFDLAVKLGTQGDKFLSVVQGLTKINPQLALDEYKNIARNFSDQIGEDSSGIKVDKSMANNPAEHRDIIDPEQVDKAINSALPTGTTSKVFLPNNIVVAKNDWSGTIDVRDVSNTIQESESNTTTRLLDEHDAEAEAIKTDPLAGASKAIKSFTRVIIDNIASVPAGAVDVAGTLVDRFQDHLFNSMTTGQKEFFKGWKPNQIKEAASSEFVLSLEAAKMELPTVINEPPANDTMSTQDKFMVEQGLKDNQHKVAKIDEAIVVAAKKSKGTINVRNNNLGNIKLLKANNWNGQSNTGSGEVFASFDTPEHGIRALRKVVSKNISATNNYEEYVNRYASEPKEQEHYRLTGELLPHLKNYAKIIAKSQGVTNIKKGFADVNMLKWIKATAQAEGGVKALEYFTDDIINRGIKMK